MPPDHATPRAMTVAEQRSLPLPHFYAPGCALGTLAVESTREELHSAVHFHALEQPRDHRVQIVRMVPRTLCSACALPETHPVASVGEDPDRKVRVFALT